MTKNNQKGNILLSDYNSPFNSIPFSKISPADLKSAMIEAIENARKNVNAIVQNDDKPTFENTLEALEYADADMAKVSHILFNLNSAETNDEIQKICQEVSPIISEYQSYVALHPELFAKIKQVYDNQDRKKLTEEQNYYLDLRYRTALRNGVNLPDDKKDRLKEINIELSKLGLTYGENVLKATNAYELLIEDESRLKGLPESAKESAREEAEKRDLNGWLFTLQHPSLLPVLKYAEDRDLRKELSLASGSKNYQNNEYDNSENIEKIVSLRQELAAILGYDSFASYVLEERMAKDTETVNHFLNDLLQKAKPYAEKEVDALRDLAANDGISEMQSYDHAYYAEKRKEQLFDYTEEEAKPYFELSKVKEAAFYLAGKLFNFTFEKRNDIEVYHPDVEVYEVLEEGNYKALLYLDFFPREGKRPGAWMTSYKDQQIKEKQNIRPHVSVVCNFTKATASLPSLLTFSEVTTLFHELGHAMHGICANTEYPALSGTSVLWDFVELPSQFLENYCYETEFLKDFAKHYKTNEVITEDLLNKIKASSNYMEGYQTLRQLSFGMLDMAYHSLNKSLPDTFNPAEFEQAAMKETQFYPNNEGTCFSTSFSHIFAGGYASGYYSYKWAEVLEADAFAYFKENGIFNPEISAKYKKMLSLGGTVKPETLYEDFRGQKPSNKALLERAGLTG